MPEFYCNEMLAQTSNADKKEMQTIQHRRRDTNDPTQADSPK